MIKETEEIHESTFRPNITLNLNQLRNLIPRTVGTTPRSTRNQMAMMSSHRSLHGTQNLNSTVTSRSAANSVSPHQKVKNSRNEKKAI